MPAGVLCSNDAHLVPLFSLWSFECIFTSIKGALYSSRQGANPVTSPANTSCTSSLYPRCIETSLPIVNVPSLQKSKGELPNRRLVACAKPHSVNRQTGVSVLFSDVIFGYLSRDYIIFSFYSLCRIGHCMHTSHESKFIPS